MNLKVTIVMYHYVRDLKNSRFPEIKGLDICHFKEQIAYLKKHYSIISMEKLIDSIETRKELPKKSVLLTFDDAYIDHYTQVFPLLIENNIQGSFFPPAKAITEHLVLDVNKIHHILASTVDIKTIINEIYLLVDKYRHEFDLMPFEYYYTKLALKNRYDSAEVIFIKRLLQIELKEEIRNLFTNLLFKKFVGRSESAFSREIYMSIEQIKVMKKFGMHIGSHGYDHYWFNSLPKDKQENEIARSLSFIEKIGGDINNWTMCYPYGAYNSDTLDILQKYNCKLALTTEVAIADLSEQNKYKLSRLDTNDIPKIRNAEVNDWYKLG